MDSAERPDWTWPRGQREMTGPSGRGPKGNRHRREIDEAGHDIGKNSLFQSLVKNMDHAGLQPTRKHSKFSASQLSVRVEESRKNRDRRSTHARRTRTTENRTTNELNRSTPVHLINHNHDPHHRHPPPLHGDGPQNPHPSNPPRRIHHPTSRDSHLAHSPFVVSRFFHLA